MNFATALYQAPKDQAELVLAWLRRARESQLVHYEMANLLDKRGRLLGIPVILITALVGTSIFASGPAEPSWLPPKFVLGMSSVLAAVLAGLQTFFKYPERSEMHRVFGARFGSVRRELEMLHASNHDLVSIDHIRRVREKLDQLAEDAPAVPASVFEKLQGSALFTEHAENQPQTGKQGSE